MDSADSRFGGDGGFGRDTLERGGLGGGGAALLGGREPLTDGGGGREGPGGLAGKTDALRSGGVGLRDGAGGRDSLPLRPSVNFLPSSEEPEGRGGTDPPGRGGIDLPAFGLGGNTLGRLELLLWPATDFFELCSPFPPASLREEEPSSFDLAAWPAPDDVLSSPMVP